MAGERNVYLDPSVAATTEYMAVRIQHLMTCNRPGAITFESATNTARLDASQIYTMEGESGLRQATQGLREVLGQQQ